MNGRERFLIPLLRYNAVRNHGLIWSQVNFPVPPSRCIIIEDERMRRSHSHWFPNGMRFNSFNIKDYTRNPLDLFSLNSDLNLWPLKFLDIFGNVSCATTRRWKIHVVIFMPVWSREWWAHIKPHYTWACKHASRVCGVKVEIQCSFFSVVKIDSETPFWLMRIANNASKRSVGNQKEYFKLKIELDYVIRKSWLWFDLCPWTCIWFPLLQFDLSLSLICEFIWHARSIER